MLCIQTASVTDEAAFPPKQNLYRHDIMQGTEGYNAGYRRFSAAGIEVLIFTREK